MNTTLTVIAVVYAFAAVVGVTWYFTREYVQRRAAKDVRRAERNAEAHRRAYSSLVSAQTRIDVERANHEYEERMRALRKESEERMKRNIESWDRVREAFDTKVKDAQAAASAMSAMNFSTMLKRGDVAFYQRIADTASYTFSAGGHELVTVKDFATLRNRVDERMDAIERRIADNEKHVGKELGGLAERLQQQIQREGIGYNGLVKRFGAVEQNHDVRLAKLEGNFPRDATRIEGLTFGQAFDLLRQGKYHYLRVPNYGGERFHCLNAGTGGMHFVNASTGQDIPSSTLWALANTGGNEWVVEKT